MELYTRRRSFYSKNEGRAAAKTFLVYANGTTNAFASSYRANVREIRLDDNYRSAPQKYRTTPYDTNNSDDRRAR